MLTVYNVKQGDSLLLAGTSSTTCCFDDEPLLIDCGLQKAAVHSKIGLTPQRIRVVVTHADRDHIGGLYDVLAHHHVSRLYIPRYLPEIQRIDEYLRKKTARRKPLLPTVSAGRRVEVAEGDWLCSHTQVMNPPRLARRVLDNLNVADDSAKAVKRAVDTLAAYGLDLNADEIMDYEPEPIEMEAGRDDNQRAHHARAPRLRERRIFYRGFFPHLAQRLQSADDALPSDASSEPDFSPTGNKRTDRRIAAALQLAANQVSIVFRYVGTTKFLFTGDADISVFRRMIKHGHPLEAEYLKVPHHGSRHNLDASSLAAISPKVAIVSHGNAKFGGDPDSHPHGATMDLLRKNVAATYYTNDVRKSGVVEASATTGVTPCSYLHFK